MPESSTNTTARKTTRKTATKKPATPKPAAAPTSTPAPWEKKGGTYGMFFLGSGDSFRVDFKSPEHADKMINVLYRRMKASVPQPPSIEDNVGVKHVLFNLDRVELHNMKG